MSPSVTNVLVSALCQAMHNNVDKQTTTKPHLLLTHLQSAKGGGGRGGGRGQEVVLGSSPNLPWFFSHA